MTLASKIREGKEKGKVFKNLSTTREGIEKKKLKLKLKDVLCGSNVLASNELSSVPGRPELKHRYWPRVDPPINDAKDIPDDWEWDTVERDLDPEDVEANIERCKERIHSGILPEIFETRLKRYKNAKRIREEMIASEPKGLSWPVVQRLNTLKQMEAYFEAQESLNTVDRGCLANIRAIQKAYRSGELKWNGSRNITLWRKGCLIGGPLALSEEEFMRKMCGAYRTLDGLWAEGDIITTSSFFGSTQILMPIDQPGLKAHHTVWFDIRIPGSNRWTTKEFRDDTGASLPLMSMDDVREIELVCGTRPQHLGTEIARQPVGNIIAHRYVFEARVLSRVDGSKPMTRWVRLVFFGHELKMENSSLSDEENTVPTNDPGRSIRNYHPTAPRLSGSWWRHMLYTATAPDNNRILYTATTKKEIDSIVPDADLDVARPPETPFGLRHRAEQREIEERSAAKRLKGTPKEQPRLHKPTYAQYSLMIEKENEHKPESQKIKANTLHYERDCLKQKYWTTEYERILKPPTFHEYCEWLDVQNITMISDNWAKRKDVEKALPTREGYKQYKLDPKNWTWQLMNDEDLKTRK